MGSLTVSLGFSEILGQSEKEKKKRYAKREGGETRLHSVDAIGRVVRKQNTKFKHKMRSFSPALDSLFFTAAPFEKCLSLHEGDTNSHLTHKYNILDNLDDHLTLRVMSVL